MYKILTYFILHCSSMTQMPSYSLSNSLPPNPACLQSSNTSSYSCMIPGMYTQGHLKVIQGHLKVTQGHLKVTLSHVKITQIQIWNGRGNDLPVRANKFKVNFRVSFQGKIFKIVSNHARL